MCLWLEKKNVMDRLFLKQPAIGHCISVYGYSVSFPWVGKSGTWSPDLCFIHTALSKKFPCFPRGLVTLGDKSPFTILCLCYLHKMIVSVCNNLHAPELGRLKLNSSIVKTPVIYHVFFSSLSPPPVPESIRHEGHFNSWPSFMIYKKAIQK